ncbi:MAG: LysR family transcriptional regulator [Rhizobacter sp.]|nr:LysR family transcriptional regulator [Rhizobacter sp.]
MSLPLVQLPPLDLIRGFVAVGRRMSITLAAHDLCVTQSAVSRQVHALEAHLGVRLLVRAYRAVTFTPEGEHLFRLADVAVQQLQDVTAGLKAQGKSRPVTVTASIGITALWLLPRLSRLQKAHPGLDVRIAASDKVSDIHKEGVDLAIRYTAAAHAPKGAIQLFGESIAPVAHPSLASTPWRGPKDLRSKVLLEFDSPRHPWLQWAGWLEARGWAAAKPGGMVHFNQYDHTIQAALAGQGVALGRLELIQPLLASGQLVVVDENPPCASNYGFWLIRADAHPRREVEKMQQWIVAESTPG